MRSRIAIAVAVTLGSLVWTMTAAADNPHGAPPGQQQASTSVEANASGSANVHAQASANVHAQAQGRAQAKGRVNATPGRPASSVKTTGHARAAARASAQASVAASSTTSTSAGVKPSSTTSHNTFALASSNQTKLYGNGQTAGQIATQAGFGNATLYGPGNSQPHKANCGPHMVDVHALKAHAARCTTTAAVTSTPATTTSAAASAVSSVAGQAPTAAATKAAAAAKTSPQAKANAGGGGVLGAKAELASATKKLKGAVLGTIRKGELPFTGLGLWFPLVLGLGLIAGGYGLRRKANNALS